ncbi:MAG: nucleotidyltransferase domain-containing protein [Methylococcaceae bacterium]|nr:MAG: nucleotidyltransferase domain-containing protein [Methylococcaceae bacterium]
MLCQVLGNHAATSLAVLVGSRCQGTPRPDSDWDIAVLLNYSLDAMAQFEEFETLRNRLAKALHTATDKIDLIDLRHAGLAMREQVANHGVLLKGENTLLWSHFLTRTWRELEEFYWERKRGA